MPLVTQKPINYNSNVPYLSEEYLDNDEWVDESQYFDRADFYKKISPFENLSSLILKADSSSKAALWQNAQYSMTSQQFQQLLAALEKANLISVTGDVIKPLKKVAEGKRASAGHKPSDFDQEELRMGIEDEMKEHGRSKEEAVMIAMDHLAENPRYYSIIKKALKGK